MLYECNQLMMPIMRGWPILTGVVLIGGLDSFANEAWWLIGLLMASIAVLSVRVFLILREKVKYVAISNSTIMVKLNGKEVDFTWLDVERISLKSTSLLYEIKIKNFDTFNFTPYGTISWLTGDDSEMGNIINKRKKELNI